MWRSPCTKSQLHSLMFSFQGKLQKHQAFEAEVQANSGAIIKLDETGNQMINESHFASETIRVSFKAFFLSPPHLPTYRPFLKHIVQIAQIIPYSKPLFKVLQVFN